MDFSRAPSVLQASTKLRQEMLNAATVYQVNIQQQLAPHPMCVKDARQTPTHLRPVTRMLTALATLAQRALTAETAPIVLQASTRLRQEMLHAATVYPVNIQQQLAPHPMCVKDARQTPTHLRRVTRTQTALATPASRDLLAARARSIL